MTKLTLKLSGKSEAKGRNGYFIADTVDIYEWTKDEPNVLPQDRDRIDVDIWSKRIGEAPPVRLKLSTSDARRLCEVLTQAVERNEGQHAGVKL